MPLIHRMEKVFFKYGQFLVKHPMVSILACLLIPILSAIGLRNYKTENNPYKLWIPKDSEYLRDSEWLWENFPPDIRLHSVIITAGNVLKPETLRLLRDIYKKVEATYSSDGFYWRDVCYGFHQIDPSVTLDAGNHCNIIQGKSEEKCMENSLLEIWPKDIHGENADKILDIITKQDVVNVVNSRRFGQNLQNYLGGFTKNASGHIVEAKSTFIQFFGKVNVSAITKSDHSTTTKGSPVDRFSLRWETSLIETLTSLNYSGYQLFPNVAKSFSDLSAEAIQTDAITFGCGTALMFVYVTFMLGKFNCVEMRPWLSFVGIICCILGILTSYGICSGLGFVFSPMHAIIPFLFVGIGVDDMFVIVQCHTNIVSTEAGESLSHLEKMSLTLKNAGVAITITSITNIIGFAVGSFTQLPALQSFCVYCAIGIAAIYIYQSTIFFAALSIDQKKRIEQTRNGLLPCIQHQDWSSNSFSQRKLGQNMFGIVSRYQFHCIGKVAIILATAGIGSVGVWGLTQIRQEFNPVWFIPQESYLARWFNANKLYFPKEGEKVKINIAQVDLSEELPKIDALVSRLEEETSIISNVHSWYRKFKDFSLRNNLVNETHGFFAIYKDDKERFNKILSQFLFSPLGAKYRGNFHFERELVCGEAAPKILLSTIELTHKQFRSPLEWIPAMKKVKQIVAEANFSNRAFPVSTEYASWETDEVIEAEFWRNMLITLVFVFLVTLFLIQNFRVCLMVLFCVVLTLINVIGFIHFWGLTIDVVSCITLIIAVGLCVDYAAHVAHNFIGHQGSGDERAVKTLRDIGPAVLNGGISTFLAFVMTAFSTSHVFITFFKVFFLVALFGMFHALIFLPVILSIIFGSRIKNQSTVNEVELSSVDNDNQEGGA